MFLAPTHLPADGPEQPGALPRDAPQNLLNTCRQPLGWAGAPLQQALHSAVKKRSWEAARPLVRQAAFLPVRKKDAMDLDAPLRLVQGPWIRGIGGC